MDDRLSQDFRPFASCSNLAEVNQNHDERSLAVNSGVKDTMSAALIQAKQHYKQLLPAARPTVSGVHNWTLSDALNTPKSATKGKIKIPPGLEFYIRCNIILYRVTVALPKIPLSSFNHVSREVLSLEKSRIFYEEILGFEVIPRPPFDCDGYWYVLCIIPYAFNNQSVSYVISKMLTAMPILILRLAGHGLNLHLIATSVPRERQAVKLRRIQHFSSALPRVDHIAFLTEDIKLVQGILDAHHVYYKHEKLDSVGIEQLFLFDPDGNVIEISNCAPSKCIHAA